MWKQGEPSSHPQPDAAQLQSQDEPQHCWKQTEPSSLPQPAAAQLQSHPGGVGPGVGEGEGVGEGVGEGEGPEHFGGSGPITTEPETRTLRIENTELSTSPSTLPAPGTQPVHCDDEKTTPRLFMVSLTEFAAAPDG